MNLERVQALQRVVDRMAASCGLRNVPHLQVDAVEFTPPRGFKADVLKSWLQRELAVDPNVEVTTPRRGRQMRVRIKYRT